MLLYHGTNTVMIHVEIERGTFDGVCFHIRLHPRANVWAQFQPADAPHILLLLDMRLGADV